MKTDYRSVNTLLLSIFSIALFLTPKESKSRVGERRETIERRLFSSGGIIYRDDAAERNRQRGMPYLKYMDFLEGSAELRVYFKTSDGRSPSTSELDDKRMGEGWDVHVLYVNGQSILEVYKRSQAMTEHEVNHLLAQLAQGSFWKRLSKEEKAEEISVFGVDMLRDDGQVRAKMLGRNSILFVESDADVSLAKLSENDLQEKAPLSVEGF